MLKKIALGGIVLLGLVYSLSIATASSSKHVDDKGKVVPQSPVPQGLCLPPGERC